MSFAKHSLQTFAIRIVLIFVGLAVSVINARWLGPEGLGILVLLLLVKSFVFRFGNLGFGSAFGFYVARKEISARWAFQMVWLIGGVVSIISGIALLAVWRYDFSPWNDIRASHFHLALLTIPLVFFNSYMQRILSGELRIFATNIANVIGSVGNVIFLGVLVIIFKMGVMGAILSVVLSDLVTFFYLVLQFRKEDSTIEREMGGSKNVSSYDLWRYGRWNYLLMFSGFFVEELPLILLKNFSAYNAPVGLFAKARGLGRQSHIVIEPVSKVLFPYTAASKREDSTSRTNILCRNSLVIMLPVVAIVMLCIKPIILLLYGEAFLPAAKIFYALAPGLTLLPLAYFLGIHLAASGKPRAVFFASLVTLGIAVAVCWILVPRYGAIGAGLSVSVIYAVRTFLFALLYTRVTGAFFSEILFPRRADWTYYRHILRIPASIFIKKANVS